MKKLLLTLICLLTCFGMIQAAQVTDVLTNKSIGFTGNATTYGTYNYTGASGAQYQLQCAGDGGTIQLRSANNNSGVVVTKSVGKVVSIQVKWNETKTTTARTLNVYGASTAFTNPTDLYASGLSPFTTFSSSPLDQTQTLESEQSYVGLRSSNGACYLDEISIVWEVADEVLAPAGMSFPSNAYTARVGMPFSSPELTKTTTAEVTYVSSNPGVATVNSSGVVSLIAAGTTTISATAPEVEGKYEAGKAEYTLTVAPALPANTVIETITRDNFELEGNSYTSATYDSPTTGITYYAYTYPGNKDAIQLRSSDSQSGLVVTANPKGYKVLAVEISQNAASQINFYESAEAYETAADLYAQGISSVGNISAVNGSIDFTTPEEFWGLRSNSGAIYVNSITVYYEPSQESDGYTELTLDQPYSITAVDGTMLKYTATQEGILTVLQTGSADTHLHSQPVSVAEGNVDSYPITPLNVDKMPQTGPYPLEYAVGNGIYYFLAKDGPYDDISAVTFSFRQTSSEGLEAVELGEEYTVDDQSPVMTFTPDESGTYIILRKSFTWDGYPALLYYDANHSKPIAFAEMFAIDENGEYGNGWAFKYDLTGGTTYYFYYPWDSSDTFVFYKGEDIVAAFDSADPAPGSTFDPTAQEATFAVFFSPNAVEIDNVQFVYTSIADGSVKTINNVEAEYVANGGAWQIIRPMMISASGKRVSDENTEGIADDIDGSEPVKYVLNNVTYNGDPVTASNLDSKFVEIKDVNTFVLTYSVNLPVRVVEATWPDLAAQNYPATADVKATLTCDAKITSVGQVSIIQGNQVWGSASGGDNPPASVELPAKNVTFSGNTITIDFAGVNLSSIGTGPATVFVQSIVGEGKPAYNVYTDHITLAQATSGPATYWLTGPIFVDGSGSVELAADENGNYTVTANVWPQTFNIQKKVGDEDVSTYTAVTDENSANHITRFGDFEAKENGTIDWVLSAVVCANSGTELTFTFNPEALNLNISKPVEAAKYISVEPEIEPANGSELTGTFSFNPFRVSYRNVTFDLGEGVNQGDQVKLSADKVKVYINDVLNTEWTDSWYGYVAAVNVAETDNQGTDGDEDQGVGGTYNTGVISISLGDFAYAYIADNSTIRIEIEEGLVTTTNGEINRGLTLNYTKPGIELPAATVSPVSGSTVEAPLEIRVSWEGFGFPVNAQTTVYYTVNGGEQQELHGGAEGLLKGENSGFGGYDDVYTTLLITFPEDAGTGTYVVTIPENGIGFKDMDFNDYQLSEPLVLNYTVDGDEPAPTPALVGMNPDNNTYIDMLAPEAVSFTMTYNVPVKITEATYGMRGEGNLEASPVTRADEEYATAWSFTFPESYVRDYIYGYDPDNELDPTLTGTVYAKTADMGEDEYVQVENIYGFISDYATISYFINYGAEFGAPVTVTVPDDAEGEFNTFKVAPGAGFTYLRPNENGWDDAAGTYVNVFKQITVTGEGFSANAVSFVDGVVTFEPAATATGNYTVTIPYNAFYVGNEGGDGMEGDQEYPNALTTATGNVTVTPAAVENALTLNFTGSANFQLPADADINDYVSVQDLFAMFASGGESDGMLDINENPYEYVYAEDQVAMMLQLTPAEGYAIDITLENTTDDSEIDATEGQTDGLWVIQGGEIGTGIVANIAIRLLPIEGNPDASLVYSEGIEVILPDNGNVINFELPLYLVGEEFDYSGFQFTLNFPADLTLVGDVALGNALQGNIATNKVADGKYNVVWTAPRPVEYSLQGDDENGLAVVNFSAQWTPALTEEKAVPVSLTNVIFSAPTGYGDILLNDFNGTVTLVPEHVPAITDIIIDKVNLAWPSYDAEFNEETASITAGENLDIFVTLKDGAAVVVDEGFVDWKSTLETVKVDVVRNDEGSVSYVINTSEAAAISEKTTVTVTASVTPAEGDAPESQTYSFELRPQIMGDSNDNGAVTVSDVVTTANYIVACEDESALGELLIRFDFPNGDVNGDNTINDSDIVETVNIVMGRSNVNRRRAAASMSTDDVLVVDDFTVALNKAFEIGVGLDNVNSYAALQAVVEIPEGMKVVGLTRGLRAADHEMTYRILPDGNVALVLYSTNNTPFAAGEGKLFNLLVTAGENAGNVNIVRIHASDANANGYYLGVAGGNNESLVTGIYDLSADEDADVRFYTVDGLEIRNPQAGQIVIRVQGSRAEKVVVK